MCRMQADDQCSDLKMMRTFFDHVFMKSRYDLALLSLTYLFVSSFAFQPLLGDNFLMEKRG